MLCGNDLQAPGVYEAARRAVRRAPADLSVVGFDDVESARWSGPPLTTVRQPFAGMGRAAAEMVLRRAAGRASPGGAGHRARRAGEHRRTRVKLPHRARERLPRISGKFPDASGRRSAGLAVSILASPVRFSTVEGAG
ncbi:substrate-binding domain-containing protein [Dactylosporangium sp. CA-233914]|uniref:substrate-binding domain-containing protein n=1 Tax=Dactylosporangium sp. CA-233914 TaxID=3239934 RepID=UPI003D8A0356